MKNIYLIVYICFLHSCYGQKQIIILNENKEFKEKYFACIDNVEAYTLNKENKDSIQVDLPLFKESLSSISRFIKVDYTFLTNYDFKYPNYEVFKKEKEKWLNWYEENKHKNLKW